MLKIGVDFDNTIACYDKAFRSVAEKLGMLSETESDAIASKIEVKEKVTNLYGNDKWTELQGAVYGRFISEATIFPGFSYFIARARSLKCEIFIVSHKTEYGVYDGKNLSLRIAALEWMEQHHFFDWLGFDQRHVTFCDSLHEKIRAIKRLELNVFIDDLPKVLDHKNFPNGTQRVLFSPDASSEFNGLGRQVSSWSAAANNLLGSADENQCFDIVKAVGRFHDCTINMCPPGRNSQVCEVIGPDASQSIVKIYSSDDGPTRLMRESEVLKLLEQSRVSGCPRLMECRPEALYNRMTKVPGSLVQLADDEFVDGALELIRACNDSKNSSLCEYQEFAKEACFSELEIKGQIEHRIRNLFQVNCDAVNQVLTGKIVPLWNSMKDTISPFHLSSEELVLVHGDLGPHNARQEGSNFYWFDFEYFGRDDPAKLVCDFILHPGFSKSPSSVKKWLDGCISIFESSKNLSGRIENLWVLHGIRWSLIALNPCLRQLSNRIENEDPRTLSYQSALAISVQLIDQIASADFEQLLSSGGINIAN